MKNRFLFLALMLLMGAQIAVDAQELTLSDVQNSGCLRGTRARANENEQRRTIILTKEGDILSVQLLGFEANCAIEGFDVTPSISGGSDDIPYSVSIGIVPIEGEVQATCVCPYNVSFSVHGLETNSFRLSCWWYDGLVSLTEGEPLTLESIMEYANIDGFEYIVEKVSHTASFVGVDAGITGIEALENIVIPLETYYEGQKYIVTSIGEGTFMNSTHTTSITIPSSVSSIGYYALTYCSSLTDVYCHAENVPTTGNDVFKGSSIASATLHIPAGSIDKYKSTSPWSEFGNIVALPIEINETTFPDENFRTYLLNHPFGSDGVLTTSEIEGITIIDVRNSGIKNLEGLEHFTALSTLHCDQNQLEVLDLSKNTALTTLFSSNNQLKTLDLSENRALSYLYCEDNLLEEIDVSNNTKLTMIGCNGNKLTSLDVSKNTALTTLYCYDNLLTELDVSNCTKMRELKCSCNQLTSLVPSAKLRNLECYKNQISGAAMDALIESLPTSNSQQRWRVIYYEGEQNVITETQVATAKGKGWTPYACIGNDELDSEIWEEYTGSNVALTDYYYYLGQRIPLTLNENKVIVSIPKECGETCERIRANVNVLNTIGDETFDILIVSRSDYDHLSSIDTWEEDAKSVILTSCYFTENNEEVCASPYLNVRLKKEQDIDLLTSYTEQYRLRIVKQDSFLPLWYILSLTLDSEKNSLECANELYETGLFAASVPDLVPLPTPLLTFTKDQMATIILPTEPDASKGKYYRLDRCEKAEGQTKGQIVFEQELQPRAHVPYIIVPSEDFSIDPDALDLGGLQADTVSIGGISFIGSYVRKALPQRGSGEGADSFYIDIIDTTPDCTPLPGEEQGERLFIGALRAYLMVHWDDPYNQGGTKGPEEKMELVLKDFGTGTKDIYDFTQFGNEEIVNGKSSNGKWYDLSGRKIVNSKSSNCQIPSGIYITGGKKIVIK